MAHKNNINELTEFVDVCKSIGVTHIGVSGFISYSPEMSNYCLYSWWGIKEVDEVYCKAKLKAEVVGIKLNYRGTKLDPGGCFACDVMYIDGGGNIVPCFLLSKKIYRNLLDKAGMSEQII